MWGMNEIKRSARPLSTAAALPDVQPFSAAELLCIWEGGRRESPVEQALTLLASACPGTPHEVLAALSIGQRDACLLDLRERLFGPVFSSLAACPGCGEQLEMNFHVRDLRAPGVPEPTQPLSLARSGYELSLRLPNSLDLLALPSGASMQELRRELFERCLLEFRKTAPKKGRRHRQDESAARSVSEIPDEIVDAAIARMSEADPQADVQLNLTCPCCEGRWKATFDIVSYLWRELQEQADRLLREVHLLASVYGWCEAEILALSSYRRQCYLEMLIG